MFNRSLLSLEKARLHVHAAGKTHAVDGIRLLSVDSLAYSVFNAPHGQIMEVLDRQASKGNIALTALEDDTETSRATLVVAFTMPVKWGMQASARAPREIVRIRDVELTFTPAA
jgi:hypothetical protein